MLVLVLFARAELLSQEPQTVHPHVLTVVMDNNYPPFVMQNPDGSLKGILVDQWTVWQEVTGIRVQLIGMDWLKAQEFMREGKADVIDTIFRNPEREQFYDFTRPYQRLDVPIYVHNSLPAITSLKDLRDFTVAVKQGDACIPRLREAGINNITEYPSYEAIIVAAKENIEFIFCIDQPPAQYFLIKYGLFRDFHAVSILYTGFFHRAVAKGNVALLKKIEEGFADIPPSTYTYISEKWFGKTSYPVLSPIAVTILIAIVSSILVALAILLLLTARMKKKISEQTANLNKILLALRQEKAFTDAVFRALPDIFYILDREGKILDVRHQETGPKEIPNTLADVMGSGKVSGIVAELMSCAAETNTVRQTRFDKTDELGLHHFELRVTPEVSNLVIAVQRDVTQEVGAQIRLEASLKEKEALLKEIHHRVKNNLQIVSSILSLQIGQMKTDEDKELLEENRKRIISIAQIHEHLYASENLNSINMAEYLSALVEEFHSYTFTTNNSIQYKLELEPISFSVDLAIAVGLITNELVTNAIKYAARGRHTIISVALGYGIDRRIVLTVEDDGPGLPASFDPSVTKTLGYTLITSLCKQHRAQLHTEKARDTAENPGLKVSVSFLQ